MIFNSFQREDDDAVFTVVKNAFGSAVAQGDVCVWDTVTPDGVRVDEAAAATLSLFRGVATQAIADGNYGRVQVHGYNAATKVEGTVPILVGETLIPVDAQRYLVSSGTATGLNGFVFAAEAYAVGSVALKKTFIRAL